MTETATHPNPPLRDVLAAQVRVVGFALRRSALIAMAVIAVTTVLISVQTVGDGKAIDFHPERHILPGLLGLLLPLAVWMSEDRFGAGFLWTLPVDRRTHALARALAGWLWLMGAVALLVLWLLALALLTGGKVFAEETLRVLPSFSPHATGPFEPSAVRGVRWMPQPAHWFIPFTAATATYLFASALALGARRPLRWIVGTVSGFVLLLSFGEALNSDPMTLGADRLLRWLVAGPYGVDALLTARTESLQVSATLATGESIVVWRALPDLQQWAAATLLWTSAGLLLLWAAAARHRERRRI
jgi:hypothetical protein